MDGYPVHLYVDEVCDDLLTEPMDVEPGPMRVVCPKCSTVHYVKDVRDVRGKVVMRVSSTDASDNP